MVCFHKLEITPLSNFNHTRDATVPASPFVSQVNRAMSQTLRTQASQEGIVPLKAWVKMVMDRVIGGCFGEPDLEFYWVGDDAVDPLEQAQTISILVGAGVKSIAEARAELGLGQASGVVKFNPNHDPSNGQFTTTAGAGSPNASRLHPISDSPNRYNVDLRQGEKRGGHTIERHVNVTKNDILNRASVPARQFLGNTEYRAVGRFQSLESANDFVNRLLERNQTVVDAVASGDQDNAWLESRFGYPTGEESLVSDDSEIPRIRPTYNVGMQIVYDASSPAGYTVKTAYPLNDYPGEDRR